MHFSQIVTCFLCLLLGTQIFCSSSNVVCENDVCLIIVDENESGRSPCLGRTPVVCSHTNISALSTPPNLSFESSNLLRAAKQLHLSNPRQAEALYKKALALDESHPEVLNAYGEFLEDIKKDIPSALEYYTEAYWRSSSTHMISQAKINYERASSLVEEQLRELFFRIEEKARRIKKIPKHSLEWRRTMEDMHFHYVYHTNGLEGNTLSLEETRSILETNYVKGASLTEAMETLASSEAYRFVDQLAESVEEDVYLFDILKIHQKVLGHIEPEEAGKYRTVDVRVSDHIAPFSKDVPMLMESLGNWLRNAQTKKLHPIERAALAHYQLVWIHPFADGNGRTCRLLVNLILMKAQIPPITIKKEDRTSYYHALKRADPTRGGLLTLLEIDFVNYCNL